MRILFIGAGEIGLPTLRMLHDWPDHELVGIVTQPDKPAGRDQTLTSPPIKKESQQFNVAGATSVCKLELPLLQPKRIKSRESVQAIRALKPDVIVVLAYGQILPRDVLEIPAIACLNLHASLLPRWRGAAPIQAAILAGDRESGITVMYMDEGLDTGDILLQSRLEIAADETGGSLHDRLALIAPEALRDALTQLERKDAPRIPQDSSTATYAPKLEREDGRIDWSEPAVLIERKIRAYNPWPGAFTILRDETEAERKLKIHCASVVVDGKNDPENLVIAARDGALRLEEVQLAGKRRMSAA